MRVDLKCGDCLELMKDIPDKSIDMILCDLLLNWYIAILNYSGMNGYGKKQ